MSTKNTPDFVIGEATFNLVMPEARAAITGSFLEAMRDVAGIELCDRGAMEVVLFSKDGSPHESLAQFLVMGLGSDADLPRADGALEVIRSLGNDLRAYLEKNGVIEDGVWGKLTLQDRAIIYGHAERVAEQVAPPLTVRSTCTKGRG